MTEKRFYYNTFYYPNTDRVMEYEIIDKESFPNYPNHDEVGEIPKWYIYISENDSNWQDMCIDKLNELNDENHILKKLNKYLEEYNNKLMKQPLLFDVQTIHDTMEIIETNNKLEEENERLKKELNKFKEVIFKDTCGKSIKLYEKVE